MASAFLPSPGLSDLPPTVEAHWDVGGVDPEDLAVFRAFAESECSPFLPVLFPMVLSFPLHMAVLTTRRFPVPIWAILQIRNFVRQAAPVPSSAKLELTVRVAAQRVRAKGVEFDLQTELVANGNRAWESIVTFYARGRFGEPTITSEPSKAPSVASARLDRWRMPAGTSRPFCRLTGDYNGIHYSDCYARSLGFRRALYHPSLVLAQCLTRLGWSPPPPSAAELAFWLKGPVYREAEVELHGERARDDRPTTFALHMVGEERPSIVGRLVAGAS